MEIRILAIGRAGRGAEAELCADYLERARKSGRAFGIRDVSVLELDERKIDGREAGSKALRAALGGEKFWLLDERGALVDSPKFADKLALLRDQGLGRLNLVIGGADGVDEALRVEAEWGMSFGKMVWPHLLVRVMLSEQIYRAVSIWGNSPYHRF